VKVGKTPEAWEKSAAISARTAIIRYRRRRRTRTARSKVRARIEHVFGAQQNSPGGRIVRTIGIARAKAKIGLQNLAYNIRRLGDAGTDGCRIRERASASLPPL
jgi:hypothetical protein